MFSVSENYNDYYVKHSERSLISSEFADTFGNTPEEIVDGVRRRLFHPYECPINFDETNWPRYYKIKEIEEKLKSYQPICAKCREFSLLSCAVMREKGIPARIRCGFCTYFVKGYFEDHHVTEYKGADGKWHKICAQRLYYDLKEGQYITGAKAWKMVRDLGFDANLFGFSVFNEYGLYYVVGNMIRDMGHLLKKELEYNEIIADVMEENHIYSEKELATLDALSDIILAEDIERLDKIYNHMKKSGKLII